MLHVGLTGSIAVGKSYVTSVFEELGAHVADADKLARDVVAVGSPGLEAVVSAFGRDLLMADGTLNRADLGAIIFADPKQRERLNSILHPLIFAAQDEVLRGWREIDPQGIGIIDASLLIESGGYRRFDQVVVVFCRPEVQLMRLRERDQISESEAQRRIASQLPQSEKLRYANFRIDTSLGFVEARRQTVEVYEQLRLLADQP